MSPLLACCVLSLAVTPATVATEPDWFTVGSWTQQNGLPHNHVNAILQTRDGYVWVGTAGGLARFDGVRFTVFDDRDPTQLADSDVRALAEGPDGSLWIGTHAGLSRLHQGRFTRYGASEGLPDKVVNKLAIDHRGRLWAAGERGLNLFEGGRFRPVSYGKGPPGIKSMHVDRHDNLWFGLDHGGLRRIPRGAVEPEEVPVPGLTRGITAIRSDADGGFWLSSYDGLFHLKGGTTRRFTTEHGLSSIRLQTLHRDAAGDIWIGAADGFHHLRGGAIHRLAHVLPRNTSVIASDREGGLWVASENSLKYLRRGQFVSVGQEHGLSYYYATTLLEDREGSLWIATGSGLNRLRGDGITVFHTDEGLPRHLIGALAEDAEGHLWVGTDDGLYRSLLPLSPPLAPPRFARVAGQPDPPVKPRVMTRARDGSLWIGDASRQLWQYRQGVFTEIPDPPRIRPQHCRGSRRSPVDGGAARSPSAGRWQVDLLDRR